MLCAYIRCIHICYKFVVKHSFLLYIVARKQYYPIDVPSTSPEHREVHHSDNSDTASLWPRQSRDNSDVPDWVGFKKPSLFKVLLRTFWLRSLHSQCYWLVFQVMTFVSPLLLRRVTLYTYGNSRLLVAGRQAN
jgi:hypothetical protein